jgi:hypothetical protein
MFLNKAKRRNKKYSEFDLSCTRKFRNQSSIELYSIKCFRTARDEIDLGLNTK